MFDIFKTWRMDSGKYKTEAEHVIKGWAQRSAERASEVGAQTAYTCRALAGDSAAGNALQYRER